MPRKRFNPLEHLPSEARLRQLQIVAQRLVESLLAGNYRSVFKGTGIEFDEVREYVEGDDTRLIDWNVSSRFGQVYTKTFREEREMTLFLVVDISESLSYGSVERSMREVALIASSLLTLAAVQNNDKVGGALFSEKIDGWIAPAKGRTHALRLLQEIITTKPSGKGSNLADALQTVSESLKRRGILVIISDFQTAGYQRELALAAKRHDVIALKIGDPVMEDLPSFPMVTAADAETGRTLFLNGRSRRFRFAFEQFWKQHRQQWLRECHRRGISAIEVSSVDNVADRLISFFRRRSTGR
ncbi:DUF58 domain-containing protein [Alkalispirochaeta alkalica]|uniref:DUF58 domain-containing protein n=1 Tax=Alkalispirochaeta alkalica TaxID=46356 RepID=UPI00037F87C4|nr:DUF58 domain-containing protein [Alkalispirochaeta alkalica]